MSGGRVGGCVGYMYIGSAADGVLEVLTILMSHIRVIQQGKYKQSQWWMRCGYRV